MTAPGPTSRVYTIDDNGGSGQDVSALIIGEPSGVGALEEILHDFTGPSSTAPVILPVGFTQGDDQTYTFQPNVGASPDCSDIFYVNRGGSRTIAITFVTGWTFSSESYIKNARPKTPPKALATLEVVFTLTGAQSVT